MKIVFVGECMFEHMQACDQTGNTKIQYGGDTVNTAVYLSRLFTDSDAEIFYVTRLGDSGRDDALIDELEAEGINCSLIEQVKDGETGSYIISVDADGERRFVYDRSNAPARGLFSDCKDSLLRQLADFDVLYVTGITLAILSREARQKLLHLMQDMNVAGKIVVYDCNHCPGLWEDEATARDVHNTAFRACNVALPSYEDLQLIFGERSKDRFLGNFRAMGVFQTVIKDGDRDVMVQTGDKIQRFVLKKVGTPRDTTGAGDSFNAGLLAVMLKDGSLSDAVLNGHRLASRVIMHPGAIISKSVMGV